ncbi:hypothetical protein [Haliangium sp.]|uniref:hypothetical protein n=1 Tax=Haliangium sp. TaxID=2663208 RepID=UPI003D0A71F2
MTSSRPPRCLALAVALAGLVLPACVNEADPGAPSPTLGAAVTTEEVPTHDITLRAQPGGEGSIVYSVQGFQEPEREAGIVRITFPSGNSLQHHFEAEGDIYRIGIDEYVYEDTVAPVSESPFADHVAATAMAVHRYYRWFEAWSDGVERYGTGDRDALASHMNVALHPDATDVGYCNQAPVYGFTHTTCEPERPAVPDVIDDCYGRDTGRDFECSAGAPEVMFFFDQRIDTRSCCLEHDRAFWCGGTRMDGTVPAGDIGSFLAWEAANAALVDCQLAGLNRAFRDQLDESPWWADIGVAAAYPFVVAGWATYWSFPGFPGMWFAAGEGFLNQVRSPWESDDEWNARRAERDRIIDERQSSCLCGGDRAVPLCGQGCRINDCSLTPPAVLDEPAFEFDEDLCPPGGECLWVCEEKTEDGEPIMRRWRTYWRSTDTGEGFFRDCTPGYEPTCECERLSLMSQSRVCEVNLGNVLLVPLPSSEGSEDDGLIEFPEELELGVPSVRPPPFIRPNPPGTFEP